LSFYFHQRQYNPGHGNANMRLPYDISGAHVPTRRGPQLSARKFAILIDVSVVILIHSIFCARPDQPWGPPSLLYNGYRISFTGLKRPGRGVNHPPRSNAEVKKEWSYTSTPPLCHHGRLLGEFYMTCIKILRHNQHAVWLWLIAGTDMVTVSQRGWPLPLPLSSFPETRGLNCQKAKPFPIHNSQSPFVQRERFH